MSNLNPIKLAFECFGETTKPPLIILHGFFASSRNWRGIAKQLAKNYQVYVLDLRNHGDSPHAQTMSYLEMAADVAEFISHHQLNSAIIIGHSMGGKVAMILALTQPQIIKQLIVVDIAPISYQHSFNETIKALKLIPLKMINNRRQAETYLIDGIPEASSRQFLLQNLQLKEGEYQWRIDLKFFETASVIIPTFPSLNNSVPFNQPVLFIFGENSTFFTETLEQQISPLFPQATIKTLAEAGHWLHAEKPVEFIAIVDSFLGARV